MNQMYVLWGDLRAVYKAFLANNSEFMFWLKPAAVCLCPSLSIYFFRVNFKRFAGLVNRLGKNMMVRCLRGLFKFSGTLSQLMLM